MEIALFLFIIAAIFIVRAIKVVPQQNAWVVEHTSARNMFSPKNWWNIWPTGLFKNATPPE